MLRTAGLALAIIVLLAAPATSQDKCPKLTRLYAEADQALNKTNGLAAQERCDAYVHVSVAWADIAKYARDQKEACDISMASLSDIDQRHRAAVAERVSACGGLRKSTLPGGGERRRFPPEIRSRW
jgi:hypothetical protein